MDLDFKSDWPKDLAPIICGMANVQGGMVLIGVKAKPNREADWPPPGVVGTEDSLRQRAIQICYDGIYPPVQPEIAVCAVDTDPSRAVVVIRVEPTRLLHATDQRKRVCVRVADHDRGYELADLSQLEWLFQQREKSIQLRQSILDRAEERAQDFAIGALQRRTKDIVSVDGSDIPFFTIYSTHVFPNQVPQTNPAKLLQLARSIPQKRAQMRGACQPLPELGGWRTTAGGAFVSKDSYPIEYLELGDRGLIYLQRELFVPKDKSQVTISAPRIMEYCEVFLLFAVDLFTRLGWTGPVLLNATLKNVRGVFLDHKIPGLDYLRTDVNTFSQDSEIVLENREFRSDSLQSDHDVVLTDILCSLMWAFGFQDTEDNLQKYLARLRGQEIS